MALASLEVLSNVARGDVHGALAAVVEALAAVVASLEVKGVARAAHPISRGGLLAPRPGASRGVVVPLVGAITPSSSSRRTPEAHGVEAKSAAAAAAATTTTTITPDTASGIRV